MKLIFFRYFPRIASYLLNFFLLAFGFDALRSPYCLCIHNVFFAEIFLSIHAKNSACKSFGSSFTFSTSILTTNFLSKTGIFSSPVAYFLPSTAIPYADALRNMTKNFPCVCKMFSICSQFTMTLCCVLRHNERKGVIHLPRQTLKKRPDGRYVCKYKGFSFYGRTQSEALAAREEYKKQEKYGRKPREKYTFAEYAAEWLPTYKSNVAINTYNKCAMYLTRISRQLPQVPLAEITSSDIKKCITITII